MAIPVEIYEQQYRIVMTLSNSCTYLFGLDGIVYRVLSSKSRILHER